MSGYLAYYREQKSKKNHVLFTGDDDFLNVSDKDDKEYREKFNLFNYQVRSKIKEATNVNVLYKDGLLQIVDLFERDCQLPKKPGFITSADTMDKYMNTLGDQRAYMAVIEINLEKGIVTDDEYAHFLEAINSIYEHLMVIKNIKVNPVKAIIAAYKWITTLNKPTDAREIAKDLPEYNLLKQIEFGKYFKELGINLSEEEISDLPGMKDIFHAIFGTGYIADAYNYTKNKFIQT
jgi:hypothetical protein